MIFFVYKLNKNKNVKKMLKLCCVREGLGGGGGVKVLLVTW